MPESASHDIPDKFIGRHGSQARSRAGLVGPLALVVALVGTGLAGLALYRSGENPAPQLGPAVVGEPTATGKSPEDAKAQACEAFATVRDAVSLQTHADLGTDPVALQAIAANARLAMIGGADYLRSRTDPAAPADLVTAVRGFADGLQAIGMNALAGKNNDDVMQAGRLKDAQAANDRIAELCK